MPRENTDELQARAQSAVVIELLGRTEALTRSELYRAITNTDDSTIDKAVLSLASVGVLRVERNGLWASDALNRLDDIGLIAV